MSLSMIEMVKPMKTSPTQKLLLLILADCHNDRTGQCNPSYRYLMQISGLSNKAVANNLHALKSSTAIFFDSRNGANTHYLLTPQRYICNDNSTSEPVKQVHRLDNQSGEPSSQVANAQAVNLVPEAVNLVPESSEPSSHKPLLTVEPELLATAETQSPEVIPEIAKPRKRKPRKEKPTDPRHCQFIEIFADCYIQAFGEKWVMNGGKDAKSLSALLRARPDLSSETWREALEWCQETAAKPFTRSIVGHTGNLAAFCSNWSGIVAYAQTYTEKK